MLGIRVLGQVDRRVRDDHPGRTGQRLVGIRVTRDQLARRLDGQRQVFHLVQVVRRGAKHLRRLFVVLEGLGKAQRAVHGQLLDLELPCAGRLLQVFPVREDRRVARLGCLLVSVITIGGALILDGRLAEVLVFEQQVGKLVVDVR